MCNLLCDPHTKHRKAGDYCTTLITSLIMHLIRPLRRNFGLFSDCCRSIFAQGRISPPNFATLEYNKVIEIAGRSVSQLVERALQLKRYTHL